MHKERLLNSYMHGLVFYDYNGRSLGGGGFSIYMLVAR